MVRFRVAFASAAHAQVALDFLALARFEFGVASPIREGTQAQFAQVVLDVAPGDARRVETLLAGNHGIILEQASIDQAIA